MGAKSVIFRLLGDSKSAEGAFKRVQKSATETQSRMDKFRSKAVAVGESFGGMGGQLAEALTSPKAAIAAVGAALITFGQRGVDAFVNMGQAALQLQRTTGATAEDASGLVAVADDLGIQADTVATSMMRLGRTVATGGDALKKYGIEVAHNADGTTNMTETLLNVADAFQSTGDPAQPALGISVKNRSTILDKGPEELEGMFDKAANTNQILSQEDIDDAEEFRLSMDELGDSVSMVARAAGEALVPALTAIANAVAT